MRDYSDRSDFSHLQMSQLQKSFSADLESKLSELQDLRLKLSDLQKKYDELIIEKAQLEGKVSIN